MEFIKPTEKGFTVYSKSDCPNCNTVKKFINDGNFLLNEINCDNYLQEDRDGFLKFIENIAETTYKTFPMVFYETKFIGGLKLTVEFIDKLLLFEDEDYDF